MLLKVGQLMFILLNIQSFKTETYRILNQIGAGGAVVAALLKAGFVVSDEFRSKVACENEVINLVCHPGQRVAIFSASFGRTQYESLQCPQPLGVQEETCMMDFATETVMQLCHGKRRCSVVANSTTFGRPDPCSPDSKTYLKVVYTCELKYI
ncbi:Uncharacterized protein DBV15_05905 [Temnothorax longispinosus]|uniref:SUEL-type lectin domain-containing protein n=1 Tax=Temnothorax longispinosus TaxID=300112 RepID=A0A4S2KI63_9HYME|nr:Uncharacterized protein DBV15_05905 [Temnothorax longispinosus]